MLCAGRNGGRPGNGNGPTRRGSAGGRGCGFRLLGRVVGRKSGGLSLQLRFDRDLRPVATKKWGTEFIKFTAADYAKMNELTEPVRTKFKADLDAKGLPGTKILDAWFKLLEKYSGPEYALK